jgi:hypothetical protein
LWNANGLQESTAEDLLRHCQSFSLVFITETWLLPPHRIRTSWTQFNLYGIPVINSYRGSQGVSALVSARCPMAVVQFPVHTKYALGLRLGRSLRLICLYLPPSLSNDEVSSVLVSLPLTDDTIICGDLNARLGALTGDYVANARGHGCGYTPKSCGCPLNFGVVVWALFMTITKVRVMAMAKK